jgi:hypothetical protein
VPSASDPDVSSIVQVPSRLPPELAVAVGAADEVTGLSATGDGSFPPNSRQKAAPGREDDDEHDRRADRHPGSAVHVVTLSAGSR